MSNFGGKVAGSSCTDKKGKKMTHCLVIFTRATTHILMGAYRGGSVSLPGRLRRVTTAENHVLGSIFHL